uniref:Uncharacterized protein n=1 Tax=Anopheles minimus TaxID=112268 RepID=A0A182VQ77_9DIPT
METEVPSTDSDNNNANANRLLATLAFGARRPGPGATDKLLAFNLGSVQYAYRNENPYGETVAEYEWLASKCIYVVTQHRGKDIPLRSDCYTTVGQGVEDSLTVVYLFVSGGCT